MQPNETLVRLTARYDRRLRDGDDRTSPTNPEPIGAYRSSTVYHAGEIAAFPVDEADALIAAGRAVAVMP
jgi:hypothetical protein